MQYSSPVTGKRTVKGNLRTTLIINDVTVPLNPYLQKYIGNTLIAIVNSLDYPGTKVSIHIIKDHVRIFSDDMEVPLKKEFTRLLVISTVKGILSPLKGIFWLERIHLDTWQE